MCTFLSICLIGLAGVAGSNGTCSDQSGQVLYVESVAYNQVANCYVLTCSLYAERDLAQRRQEISRQIDSLLAKLNREHPEPDASADFQAFEAWRDNDWPELRKIAQLRQELAKITPIDCAVYLSKKPFVSGDLLAPSRQIVTAEANCK